MRIAIVNDMLLAVEALRRVVLTARRDEIAWIARDGAEAVQTAWQQLDVVQCGYCQSGQVMTAIALLSEIDKPSDADIDAGLAGNICRCATYHRIRAAVHEAARLVEA